jgi:hypothetical protein
VTRDTAARHSTEAERLGIRPTCAHERHQAAVANTLGWADEAAARHDFRDALAWLNTLEAIGETLPDRYVHLHEVWTRCLHASTTANAEAA